MRITPPSASLSTTPRTDPTTRRLTLYINADGHTTDVVGFPTPTPGLYVHRGVTWLGVETDDYTVSTASGLRLTAGHESPESALDAAVRLGLAGIDWTATAAEILALPPSALAHAGRIIGTAPVSSQYRRGLRRQFAVGDADA